MYVRQDRLKKELEKTHFAFKTNCLDLPQGANNKDFLSLDKDTMDTMESTEASMAKDLD